MPAHLSLTYVLMPYWDDLLTNQGPSEGIYTSVTGIAPNRIFNVEWRAITDEGNNPVDFEARLYEGIKQFSFIYGTVVSGGSGATVGVQRGTGSQFTQFWCNMVILPRGLQLIFTQYTCGPVTPTATPVCTGVGAYHYWDARGRKPA